MSATLLSSKGQIVIPKETRERYKLKPGAKISIQETPHGIVLVPIPDNPLLALKGMLKGTNISSKTILEMRRKDAEHERKKYSHY